MLQRPFLPLLHAVACTAVLGACGSEADDGLARPVSPIQAGVCAPHEDVSHVHDDTIVLEGRALLARRFAEGAASFSPPAGGTFSRVGLMYDVAEPAAELWYRALRGGVASAARAVPVVFAESIARVGHIVLPAEADALELELRGGALRFLSVSFFAEPPACLPPPEPGSRIDGGLRLTQPLELDSRVHPQSDWAQRDTGTCGTAHTPKIFTIHHTDTPIVDSLTPPERLRQIQAYHIDVQGWCDIGYHFLVSQDGQLWRGRKTETRTGSHVADHNTGNVGVAFLGSYQMSAVADTMVASASWLLGELGAGYAVPLTTEKVIGHRQWSDASTDCPGTMLLARLGELLDGSLDSDGDGVPAAEDCDDADRNNWAKCATCKDADGDRFYAGCDRYLSIDGPDCDDGNASISPIAAEILADGIDQDCDGSDALTCYMDLDGDGFGSERTLQPVDGGCDFVGASSVGSDCDDGDARVYPGALEFCDAVDSDCDGNLVERFPDSDRDGLPDCADDHFDGPTPDLGELPDAEPLDEEIDGGCAAAPASGPLLFLLASAWYLQRRRARRARTEESRER